MDDEGFGTLRLTEAARPVLQGKTALALRRDPAGQPRQAKKTRGDAALATELNTADRALVEHLRAYRKELAETQGVPPYVIFHDATLSALALTRPSTLEEMAGISGVGDVKLARYGDGFVHPLTTIEEDAQRPTS